MKLYVTRLQEGQDLLAGIVGFAQAKALTSGVVLSAPGSLSQASIRTAFSRDEEPANRRYAGPLEIVSLIGTVSSDGNPHIHISFSDRNGQVFGGHVSKGCIVDTTVELVLGNDSSLNFTRELDPATGFNELKVSDI
ncbi:MAG TPA: PPC domain-containing DNA-binding protein [Candidatus Limnocylindria bacterium]|nr:PPC domain-containing DNA-binding protein [Candidatus Limnocylindria bacterium]